MKEPVTSKHSCFRCAQVARATRGRGLPSFGLMARLGVPVGGRVRRLRAVEDQSAPIPKEITSKLGRSICSVRCAQLGSSHPPLIKDDDDLYRCPQPWTGGRSQSAGRIVRFLKEMVLCEHA
jgi:hypothetical protein